jgi:hypothetical protein
VADASRMHVWLRRKRQDAHLITDIAETLNSTKAWHLTNFRHTSIPIPCLINRVLLLTYKIKVDTESITHVDHFKMFATHGSEKTITAHELKSRWTAIVRLTRSLWVCIEKYTFVCMFIIRTYAYLYQFRSLIRE